MQQRDLNIDAQMPEIEGTRTGTTEALRYPQADRRAGLSLRDFNREYRDCARPVILEDAIENWRSRSAWTFEFFKSRYGESPVLVYRYEHLRYLPQKGRHVPLSEYIDAVLSKDWDSCPEYIRDNWTLLVHHPELSGDYSPHRYFFDWYSLLPRFMRLHYPRIFIGPRGAVTPLHSDIWGTHGWHSQLVGRKRWLMFPPEQQNLLYDFRMPPDQPDLARYPLYRQTRPLECTIGPGDTLFIPSGWIHCVTSLDATISLGSNFIGPGCFWPALPNALRDVITKQARKVDSVQSANTLKS
jgi:hypothetical protein